MVGSGMGDLFVDDTLGLRSVLVNKVCIYACMMSRTLPYLDDMEKGSALGLY